MNQPALSVVHQSIAHWDFTAFIQRELPLLTAFYFNENGLHADVRAWLDFYLTRVDSVNSSSEKASLPVYQLHESVADESLECYTQYYAMLLDALDRLFELEDEDVRQWIALPEVSDSQYATFLAYARAMWRRLPFGGAATKTLYGRFDGVMNPVSGRIEAVYEFNGDTPVMLFESVNLQNAICEKLGDPQAQANDWWALTQASLVGFKDKAAAVVFDPRFIEDAATCETIGQVLESVGARVYLTPLEGLNHDVLSLSNPFFVDGVVEHPEVIFILLPWEEMMTSGYDILSLWEHWHKQVIFLEPAWRWFISHKGMLAYVTHLFETEEKFVQAWGHLPHLPTYLTPESFIAQNQPYVQKPVIGRLSQNITIVKSDEATQAQTPGAYGQVPMVYQAYYPPYTLPGRGRFIACGWMADRTCATLAFREFDGEVLELSNERFVVHAIGEVGPGQMALSA